MKRRVMLRRNEGHLKHTLNRPWCKETCVEFQGELLIITGIVAGMQESSRKKNLVPVHWSTILREVYKKTTYLWRKWIRTGMTSSFL